MPKPLRSKREVIRERSRKRTRHKRRLILGLVIHQMTPRWTKFPHIPFGQRKSYGHCRASLALISSKISCDKWFRKNVGFSREVFNRFVLYPVYLAFKRREASLKRKRHATISLRMRVVRYVMWLRGAQIKDLCTLFGSSETQAYRDIIAIGDIFASDVFAVWVRWIRKESEEYEKLKCVNGLAGVSGGIYCSDICKVKINNPCMKRGRANQFSFYDGKSEAHALGTAFFIDSFAQVRGIIGPTFGWFSDQHYYTNSLFGRVYDRYANFFSFLSFMMLL